MIVFNCCISLPYICMCVELRDLFVKFKMIYYVKYKAALLVSLLINIVLMCPELVKCLFSFTCLILDIFLTTSFINILLCYIIEYLFEIKMEHVYIVLYYSHMCLSFL